VPADVLRRRERKRKRILSPLGVGTKKATGLGWPLSGAAGYASGDVAASVLRGYSHALRIRADNHAVGFALPALCATKAPTVRPSSDRANGWRLDKERGGLFRLAA
jgi:hypothetical protein